MKQILVIGAGRSAFTLIRYLLNESILNNWKVIVADYNLDLAKKTCLDHVNARPIFFNVNDISAFLPTYSLKMYNNLTNPS